MQLEEVFCEEKDVQLDEVYCEEKDVQLEADFSDVISESVSLVSEELTDPVGPSTEVEGSISEDSIRKAWMFLLKLLRNTSQQVNVNRAVEMQHCNEVQIKMSD